MVNRWVYVPLRIETVVEVSWQSWRTILQTIGVEGVKIHYNRLSRYDLKYYMTRCWCYGLSMLLGSALLVKVVLGCCIHEFFFLVKLKELRKSLTWELFEGAQRMNALVILWSPRFQCILSKHNDRGQMIYPHPAAVMMLWEFLSEDEL